MTNVFEIEEIVERLFNEVCPRFGSVRGLKPLLAPSLGQMMPEANVRTLVEDREYYRVDFNDFIDYATSTLPPQPLLGMYQDGRALFFEAIDRRPQTPHFTSSWNGKEFGLSILDVILARHQVFVSVTVRFLIYWDTTKTYREQYGELEPDRVAGATALATLNLAATPPAELTRFELSELEQQPLEDWDRHYVMPPVPSDLEWRFIPSGVYTDYLIEESKKDPLQPGALTQPQIEMVEQGKELNEKRQAVEFDLARLCLSLTSYIDFMFDLVVTESVSVKPRRGTAKPAKATSASKSDELSYRIIKSVRVIRPKVESESQQTARHWTPPSYRYAVQGHWRVFKDSNRKGHDPTGATVRGKTWVHSFEKGLNSPYPFPTSSGERASGVVINIKEPLQYGRDEVLARQGTEEGVRADDVNESTQIDGNVASVPSEQWRAKERAKLSAGLRYFILSRDNFRCRLCGRSAADENGIRLEVDHRVPIHNWGRTEEKNLWTLCNQCNKGKGVKPISPA
jgi:5-methylcytosine-specific restriction endonuclease McrA